MHRMFRLSISIGETLFVAKRCLSVSSVALTWNPIHYSQNLDVGRQTFQVYAVKTLIDQFPNLSISDVNDVAGGLACENFIQGKLKGSQVITFADNSNDILARIGELRRKNCASSESTLDEILEEINKRCLSTLSSEDTSSLIKSRHPRFLLRHFCDLSNVNVYTSSKRQDNGFYLTSVYFEKEVVSTEKHEVKEESECLACLAAIQNKFKKNFNEICLSDFNELPPDSGVDIGREHRQRVVNIIKLPADDLGFTIRGGQQKVIKNKDYVQLNIITPILISDVKEGLPAHVCGLRVGDVLLGVNDHALTNKTHEQAVIALQKVTRHEEVSLTVIHNKHELLKYEAEQKIIERELVRTMEEIKSPQFDKWHESKSKVDPMEYFMEKFVDKKRQYQHKRGGNTNRLWHQYKSNKRHPRAARR